MTTAALVPFIALAVLAWRRAHRPSDLADELGPLGPSTPSRLDIWTNTNRGTDRIPRVRMARDLPRHPPPLRRSGRRMTGLCRTCVTDMKDMT